MIKITKKEIEWEYPVESKFGSKVGRLLRTWPGPWWWKKSLTILEIIQKLVELMGNTEEVFILGQHILWYFDNEEWHKWRSRYPAREDIGSAYYDHKGIFLSDEEFGHDKE